MPDYSLKRLHVAVAEYPTEDGPMLRGIIFYRKNVFNGMSQSCLRDYHQFFERYTTYHIVVVETHMGPGELAKALYGRGVRCSSWTGGVLADIQIHEDLLDDLLTDLRIKAEDFVRSEEGGVPA